MPDLEFHIDGADVLEYAAVPSLRFSLRIENHGPEPIRSIMLAAQIRIVPRYRSYMPAEERRLAELFGRAERWGSTLNSFVWTHSLLQVPAFDERIAIDMPITCTYDFDVVATKYFHALEGGEIALEFLFSGSIFYEGPTGLQVTQIPWEKEASFRLPVQLWHEMMEHYFPNSTWLRVGKDVFDRLHDYKIQGGFASWDAALETLLQQAEEEVDSPWMR